MSSPRILIVDDEVYVRLLLEQTLEDFADRHGMTLYTATDGVEGLEMAREIKPALIFLDIVMPGMNGIAVCKNITADPALHKTQVILLTASGRQADRPEGLAAGATAYLTKPFDPDAVVGLAAELLGLNP
jgi:two-component system, OmpR family, alkaline phosphatase synthesis response regulator PhoP